MQLTCVTLSLPCLVSYTPSTPKLGTTSSAVCQGGRGSEWVSPSVYWVQFWDNSTRGLDSANALEFMKMLRLGAESSGCTPFVTIYQCSQNAYNVCFLPFSFLYAACWQIQIRSLTKLSFSTKVDKSSSAPPLLWSNSSPQEDGIVPPDKLLLTSSHPSLTPPNNNPSLGGNSTYQGPQMNLLGSGLRVLRGRLWCGRLGSTKSVIQWKGERGWEHSEGSAG